MKCKYIYIVVCVTHVADVNIKDIYHQFYPQLVTSLPMKDAMFVACLIKLFPDYLRYRVFSASTSAEAAVCFLDNAIGLAIEIGHNEPFTMLLTTMEASEINALRYLAKGIRKEIQKLKPGSGKYGE